MSTPTPREVVMRAIQEELSIDETMQAIEDAGYVFCRLPKKTWTLIGDLEPIDGR